MNLGQKTITITQMPEAVHISLRAEELFRVGSFPVTNALLTSTLVVVILSLIVIAARRRFSLIPAKVQNFAELVMEQLLGLMDTVFGDRKKSEKYFPLVATIFLFVLFSNWLGLFPGIGSVVVRGGENTPLLRSPASDLNFTLALAIITVVTVNIVGIVAIGFFSYASKFFNFANPIQFFIGMLEFVSEIAKMISFSFRLFGNVFAGEVLLTIITFLVPYLVPAPFLFLETFVGFIQAFIFAMLAIVFITIATTEHSSHA